MPLRPPKELFKDLRDLDRWCRQQQIIADDDSIDTAALQDDSVTTPKIADGAVELTKLADMTADRVLGRLSTAGTPQELTADQLAGLADNATTWAFTATTMGFFSATPVAQQTMYGAISADIVSGTGDDSTINANFAEVYSALLTLRTALNNLGLTAT